jgi:hypothetical protein
VAKVILHDDCSCHCCPNHQHRFAHNKPVHTIQRDSSRVHSSYEHECPRDTDSSCNLRAIGPRLDHLSVSSCFGEKTYDFPSHSWTLFSSNLRPLAPSQRPSTDSHRRSIGRGHWLPLMQWVIQFAQRRSPLLPASWTTTHKSRRSPHRLGHMDPTLEACSLRHLG